MNNQAKAKLRNEIKEGLSAGQNDLTYFEGRITRLFMPFLITCIPEGSWQTLQERLGLIIREILRKEG